MRIFRFLIFSALNLIHTSKYVPEKEEIIHFNQKLKKIKNSLINVNNKMLYILIAEKNTSI